MTDPWHEQFACEYVANGGNGTKAVQKHKPGMGDNTAHVAASRLLRNATVQRLIESKLRSAAKLADLDRGEVLQELKRIGMADVAEAIDDDGCVKPIRQIDISLRRAVSGMDVEEIWEGKGENRKQVGVIKKIRFWNKVGALELLGKNLELWIEKIKLVDNNPHSAQDLDQMIVMLTRLRDAQKAKESDGGL